MKMNPGLLMTGILWVLLLCGCASVIDHNQDQVISFEIADFHGQGILPAEFKFDAAAGRCRWSIGDDFVFQISIFRIPENQRPEQWRKSLRWKFLTGKEKEKCRFISRTAVDYKVWKGEKDRLEDNRDCFSYWFLSNDQYFVFASLIGRDDRDKFTSLDARLETFFVNLKIALSVPIQDP